MNASRQAPQFRPQDIGELRKRIPGALVELWDPATDVSLAALPESEAKHVFDCQDGIRLIVSRETFQSGFVIHVSASLQQAHGTAYEELKEVKPLARRIERFHRMAQRRFSLLSDINVDKFLIREGGDEGIYHFYLSAKAMDHMGRRKPRGFHAEA